MDIVQVTGSLVCTQRVAGLEHCNLRVVRNAKGKLTVAVDPVGARPGNWVFTASGSAARFACGNPEVQTDLTIAGIIDFWDPSG
jgi:carboxysome peptide B